MKGARELLLAEACARRWFLDRRIPCWTDPTPPGGVGRYGLLFRSGRRALILPSEDPVPTMTFDGMMKARCDYLITVGFTERAGGEPEGYLCWHDLPRSTGIAAPIRIPTLRFRSIETFPELLERPRRFRTACIIGALHLLIRGEPVVPPPLDSGE